MKLDEAVAAFEKCLCDLIQPVGVVMGVVKC